MKSHLSFAASLIGAVFATAPPQEEFHSGSRRWKHLKVSMDQYDTLYFDNYIDHLNGTQGLSTYK